MFVLSARVLLLSCFMMGRHMSGCGKCALPLFFGGLVFSRCFPYATSTLFDRPLLVGCNAEASCGFSPPM